MEAAGVKLVPVIDGVQIMGVLSREQVMRYLRLRTELGT
jgi:predicted transcriptional regulator